MSFELFKTVDPSINKLLMILKQAVPKLRK